MIPSVLGSIIIYCTGLGIIRFVDRMEADTLNIGLVTELDIASEKFIKDSYRSRLEPGFNVSNDLVFHMAEVYEALKEKSLTQTDEVDIPNDVSKRQALDDMAYYQQKLLFALEKSDKLSDRSIQMDSIIPWEAGFHQKIDILRNYFKNERNQTVDDMRYFIQGIAVLFIVIIILNRFLVIMPIKKRFKMNLERLENQKTQLRTLIDSSDDLIWSADGHGRLLLFNAAFAHFFENLYKKSPIPNQKITDMDFFARQRTACLAALEGRTLTIVHEQQEGTVLESRFNPIVLDGDIIGWLVRSSDVTKRETLIIELKRIKKELAEAQEIANIGSWNWDMAKKEIQWSDHLYSIFGKEKGLFTPNQDNLKEFIHPSDLKAYNYLARRCSKKKGRRNFSMTYRVILGDNKIRYVQQKGKVFCSKDDTPARIAGTIQDVTDRVLAHKKIEKQNKELQNFIHIISHNLRRPLSNLLALSSQYTLGLHKENDWIMERVQDSCQNLDTIIRDLNFSLSLKEVDIHKMKPVALDQIMNDVTVLLQKELLDSKAQLEMDLACDKIIGIKSYYVNILYNLILNAIKYAAPGRPPHVKLSIMGNSDLITIKVQDNGIGMKLTPDRQKKIFDMYGRLSGKTEGKGLGLYLVKSQVEAMNGTIKVTSELNKGTTFEIEIDTAKIKNDDPEIF